MKVYRNIAYTFFCFLNILIVKESDYCMNDTSYNDYYSQSFYYPQSMSENSYWNYETVRNMNPFNEYTYQDRKDDFYSPNEGYAKGNMQSNIYKPYKIKNPSLPRANNERENLLLDIQKYSFAMWDLNLYLNTHPTDKEVIRLFEEYRIKYREALNRYENKYGSLYVSKTNTNENYWQWNKSPWPWEV